MTDDKTTRILIVDDSALYRKFVGNILESYPNFEVAGVAANGKIALQKIEQLQPDIITLDLEMPVMDGLEVLRQLKPQSKHVGVIMLSAVTTEGAKSTLEALRLGAFDFVVKPSNNCMEENIEILTQSLCPKINAFVKTQQVSDILSGKSQHTPEEPDIPPDSSCTTKSVIQRMGQITRKPPGKPEIVVIGISTGGPQSLAQVLPQLPGDLETPILIVQHMPPLFTKSLAEDLNNKCSLTVSEAEHEQPIEPGHILIAPGGRQMKVQQSSDGNQIILTDDPPENNCRPSVDYLFRSVADAYGENVLAIIMTGMGNDGTLGCRLLKQNGAFIMTQDKASCVVYGMPKQLTEEGVTDAVVPLDQIAQEIVHSIRQTSLCM